GFRGCARRARGGGSAYARRRRAAARAIAVACARHRQIDLAGRPIDRRHRDAARDDGGRGARRAASGAEIPRGGVAEREPMKTSDLIAALAADGPARSRSIGRRLALALGVGALVSAALFMAALGPRLDISAAAHTKRFDMKFLDTLALQ